MAYVNTPWAWCQQHCDAVFRARVVRPLLLVRRMRIIVAIVALLCCLDLTAGYTISLLEQTLTITQCNVSVAEVITVVPDDMENITKFTRDVTTRSGWTFSSEPTRTVSLPSQDVSFPNSGAPTLVVIDFLVPPTSPFNVSISYAFTSLVLSRVGNLSNENSFEWLVRPPTGIEIMGTGFLFVAVFQDAEEATATVNSVIYNGTINGNDSFVAYAQTFIAADASVAVAIAYQNDAVCIIDRDVRDVAAGAIVGIVLGTLSGTVVLLVVLNLICGYFSPALPRRA